MAATTDARGQPSAGPIISARSVTRAASWAWLGQLISQASGFISLLILAALVPPKSFGLVSAGMVIVSIALLLVGSGTRGSIIVSGRLTPEHIRYALAVNVGAGLALTAVVMALAGPIVRLFSSGANASVLQGLVLSVGVFAISVVPMAMLQKELRFKQESSVKGGAAVVASVVAIAAAILGAGVWALVLRQVLNSALTALLAWIAAWRLLPNWRQLIGRARRPQRVHRPNAGGFFVLSLFTLMAMSVDYFVVGSLTNATQLGLYSLAFTLGFAPLTQFSWRLGQVILPAVAATTGADAIERRTVRASGATATVLLPLVPAAMALAPWLVPTVFGSTYHIYGIFPTAGGVATNQGILRAAKDQSIPGSVALAITNSNILVDKDYILDAGNPNVVLCERGIRTFETHTRFTLPLSGWYWQVTPPTWRIRSATSTPGAARKTRPSNGWSAPTTNGTAG